MIAQQSEPAYPDERINLCDLLDRVSVQLEQTAAAILRVESSLCVLIGQAAALSPKLIRELQEIDRAHQSILDISRVAQMAADASGDQMLSLQDVLATIKLRDLALALLRPQAPSPVDRREDEGGLCWL